MGIEFDEMRVEGSGASTGTGRRRVVVAIAATMLVAAAAGAGYGIGRAAVDDDMGTVGSPAGDDAAGGDATGIADDVGDDTPSTSEPVAADQDDMASDGDVAESAMASGGGFGYSMFGTQPLETNFERTTDAGVVLRAQLGPMWDDGFAVDEWEGGWQPPAWCFESGQFRIAMSGDGVIDVGGAPWYREPFRGRAVSWVLLGGNDGRPTWVVVVQAPADVRSVRVDFADGTVDEAEPTNGVVLLTGPAVAPMPVTEDGYTYWVDPPPSFTVSFLGGADPVTFDAGDGRGSWDDPEFRASCSPPPPALPAAGEQPADAAAAEAEIRATMDALYGAIAGEEVAGDLLDDDTGVASARAEVEAGGFADDAASATADIVELVFTSPVEAWFRYSIDTDGSDFDNRFGIAVSIDGSWKITRATVCQDLQLAGGSCGPGWEPIRPPSESQVGLPD